MGFYHTLLEKQAPLLAVTVPMIVGYCLAAALFTSPLIGLLTLHLRADYQDI